MVRSRYIMHRNNLQPMEVWVQLINHFTRRRLNTRFNRIPQHTHILYILSYTSKYMHRPDCVLGWCWSYSRHHPTSVTRLVCQRTRAHAVVAILMTIKVNQGVVTSIKRSVPGMRLCVPDIYIPGTNLLSDRQCCALVFLGPILLLVTVIIGKLFYPESKRRLRIDAVGWPY